MKYIIIPIVKLIVIIIVIPILFFCLILIGLWDFKFIELKSFIKSPFKGDYQGERYYEYQTVWDWFLDRKKYPHE